MPTKATKTPKKKTSSPKVKLAKPEFKLFSYKSAAIFASIFVVAGAALLLRAHAAVSLLHEYHCGSPGVYHTAGTGQQRGYTTGEQYPITCNNVRLGNGNDYVWDASRVDALGYNNVNGHYMWYGPYVSLNPGHTLQACWTYIPPSDKSAHVIFDINYANSGVQHLLWSSGDKTIQAVKPIGGVWQEQRTCQQVYLFGNSAYNNLEIRVKVTSLGDGIYNSFKMYKTSWQLLN